MPEHTTPTPRGVSRRARTDQRIATAVADQLRERGYTKLTIEGVSAASGVAKTTIYRRWASKAEMVFELVIHRADHVVPIDSGTLAGDIQKLAERAVALVAGDPGKDVLPGLLADMAGDADLAARMREAFINAAREDIARILDQALARGELTTKVDVDTFHSALLGIPYAHTHLLASKDTHGLTALLVDQLLRLLPTTPEPHSQFSLRPVRTRST